MGNCSSCGSTLQDGVRFCVQCGTPVPTAPPQPRPAASAPAAVAASDPPATDPIGHPPTEPLSQPATPSDRRRWEVTAGIVVVLALCAGLFAAFLTRPGEAGELVADVPIGPDGGTISFGHRAKIDIPAGAVDEPTRITVRRTTVDRRVRLRPPNQPPRVFPPGTLIVFVFGPIDIVFNVPVTITLPIPSVGVPGLVVILVSGDLRFAQGTVDVSNGTITIRTTNFQFTGVST